MSNATTTESEKALCGCLLMDAAVTLSESAPLLPASAFTDPACRAVWGWSIERAAQGLQIDPTLCVDAFRGQYDAATITSMIDAASTPALAGSYADVVRHAAKRRILGDDLRAYAARVEQGHDDPAALASELRDRLEAIAANSRPDTLPAIVNAASFTAAPMAEPDQVIHGVLHRGSKAVYGGPSKAFKSWSLLDMCIAVSTGGEWLGFPTTAGDVLYINFELQPFAVHARLLAICAARRIPVPDRLHIWNLRGHGQPLSHLLPQLKRNQYSLVVPDPIYKTLASRNENDAGAIAEVCNEIEAISIATGAAVAFGAHFAKGNAAQKNAIDRMSGSGVFARDPDAIITATPHEEADSFVVDMTLRNFPQPENFVIRWQYPRMTRDGMLDPSKLKQPKLGRSPEHDPADIVRLLAPSATTKAWATACKEEAGIGESSFWRLLRRAVALHLVVKQGGLYVKASGVSDNDR